MTGIFRSLAVRNYRLWAAGALVSNIGTWMQRTAQDWLVLTELTHNNATSVGIVMALQFGPQVLLLPWTGYAADHLDRRKLLMATQGAMGLLALGLGLLTVLHRVQLWQVYGFALGLGCVAAFDSPARQAFVSELVGEEELTNAVGLNSTSFHSARMIGPALAGVLIAGVGTGWVFLINAISFVAVLGSLLLLRVNELHRKKEKKERGKLRDGFLYVWGRADLQVPLAMALLIGMFGLNFPIFISTMAVTVFHLGAKQFALLTSTMAIGSVSGALMAAGREKPTLGVLLTGAGAMGVSCTLAGLAPNPVLFAVALMLIGVSAQTFTTSVNSLLQLTTEASMRGRVLAIFLAIALGGTPIGAPIVGRVADHFGPRWGLAVGAAGAFGAAAIALVYRFRAYRCGKG